MTELKTVKDIKKADEFDRNKFSVREGFKELIDKGELKAEVINWVKTMRERGTIIMESDFMEFHNISEEDLK